MIKLRFYLEQAVGSDKFEKWLKVYIHHRNLYAKGHGEVGFFKNLLPLQSLMILWLFLKSILGNIPNEFIYIGIPLIIMSKAALHWVVGWLWEECKIFDKENDWNNKRNEAMRTITNNFPDQLSQRIRIVTSDLGITTLENSAGFEKEENK